jgi:hypothetical protein
MSTFNGAQNIVVDSGKISLLHHKSAVAVIVHNMNRIIIKSSSAENSV